MSDEISQEQIETLKKRLADYLKRELSADEFKIFHAFVRKKNITKAPPTTRSGSIDELAGQISKLAKEHALVDASDWVYTIWEWHF